MVFLKQLTSARNAITPTPAMNDLFKRLRTLRLTKHYIHNVILPDWWDDSIADSATGYAEALMYISRFLGIDILSLQDPGAELRFRELGICKYKKTKNIDESKLQLARVIATRAAELAIQAVDRPHRMLPGNADAIRNAILEAGEPFVGLPQLLQYSWDSGIPVLQLDHFPKGAVKPHGFAARIKGRPVIVLCNRKKHPAWQLYYLAHELGHIALGHLEADGILLDIDMDSTSQDSEELEANRFADELLTGKPAKQFRASERWPKAEELAREAMNISREQQIDPGHIILNYAHTMGKGFFPIASAALGRIPEKLSAIELIREQMANNLDWSKLPEETSEFLMRITQCEPATSNS